MQHHDRATPWKIAIALLMGTVLLLTVASFLIAGSSARKVVDRDYYNHGLNYDTYEGSGAAWRISANATAKELEVRVQDASGAPVTGGRMACQLERQQGASPPCALVLAEASPGSYRASRAALPPGDVHAVVQFTRGNARTSRRVVIFP